MSASRPGIMRGPRLKTPLLLLLLLLLTALTQSVLCQDEEEENTDPEAETPEEEPEAEAGGDGDTTTPVIDASPPPDSSFSEDTGSDLGTEEGDNHGSGDDIKRNRNIDIDGFTESTPTSTMYPDGITSEPGEEEELSLILILVPVVLVALICMILCAIFVNRRRKQKGKNPDLVKDDPYLDGSSTEKVPMPMFEEDVPSVLELEMEELGQWMKKDSVTADDSHHA
ncbi:transmembrane protein 154 [Salarias fasciatus]|uniref:Transmembrane protein 154 n=1 Tax=Salarias fasciatus TaxID=181472 RepID=A0A672H1C3_SALFA|nr:transmembrane protein 154 [Salarias fasciatus]